MRKIIGAALLVMLSAVGCSSEEPAEEPAKPSATAPTFDKDAAKREAWEGAERTYSAQLKLRICDAAEEGGAAAIGAVLTDEEQMPFVVEDPEYDAQQWAKYCG